MQQNLKILFDINYCDEHHSTLLFWGEPCSMCNVYVYVYVHVYTVYYVLGFLEIYAFYI